MKSIELISKSVEETQDISKKIAQKIEQGGVLCLYGDLGSGKTTFTQGIAHSLGIQRRVNSPTFIIMRSYKIELKNKNFYHLDLYRIHSEKDIEGLGIKEILADPSNIVVIEWPEKLKDTLPEHRIDIHFTYRADTEREIVINEY